jgi:hypothetical protein
MRPLCSDHRSWIKAGKIGLAHHRGLTRRGHLIEGRPVAVLLRDRPLRLSRRHWALRRWLLSLGVTVEHRLEPSGL